MKQVAGKRTEFFFVLLSFILPNRMVFAQTETAAPRAQAPTSDAQAPATAPQAEPPATAAVELKPETAKPELAKPELAKPELAKPELAKPELAKPESAPVQIVKPEPTAVPAQVNSGAPAKPSESEKAGNESLPAAKPTTAVPSSSSADDGEYEIDYEEEPGYEGDDAEEAPAPKKKSESSRKKTTALPGGGSGGIQGSRAKHRFTPILKSETKSVYKKDGKQLDVDSD